MINESEDAIRKRALQVTPVITQPGHGAYSTLLGFLALWVQYGGGEYLSQSGASSFVVCIVIISMNHKA